MDVSATVGSFTRSELTSKRPADHLATSISCFRCTSARSSRSSGTTRERCSLLARSTTRSACGSSTRARLSSSGRRIRIQSSTWIGTTTRRSRLPRWTSRSTVRSLILPCRRTLTSSSPRSLQHLARLASPPIQRTSRRSQRRQVLPLRHPPRLMLGRPHNPPLVSPQHPRPRARKQGHGARGGTPNRRRGQLGHTGARGTFAGCAYDCVGPVEEGFGRAEAAGFVSSLSLSGEGLRLTMAAQGVVRWDCEAVGRGDGSMLAHVRAAYRLCLLPGLQSWSWDVPCNGVERRQDVRVARQGSLFLSSFSPAELMNWMSRSGNW